MFYPSYTLYPLYIQEISINSTTTIPLKCPTTTFTFTVHSNISIHYIFSCCSISLTSPGYDVVARPLPFSLTAAPLYNTLYL